MVTLRGVIGYSHVTRNLYLILEGLVASIRVYHKLLSVHKPFVSYHVPTALFLKKKTTVTTG